MPGKWLSDQISFQGPIPSDIQQTGIRAKLTAFYDPYMAVDRESLQQLDNNQLLAYILKNTDIDILLKTLGNAFFPRVITVGTTPTNIIEPNRYPRGYILINPNSTVTSVTSNVTAFASQVFPIGVTNSAAFNVGGFGGASFILNVTNPSAGPVTFDLQTQDPISGNWATSQLDIFSGSAAVGTYYAQVGSLGVDNFLRVRANVAGAPITASIAMILKPALAGTIAGPTVFLGSSDVNVTVGFPLLGGQKETIYLKENTPIFGIATAATEVRLFELQ